ncbi:MAG: aspartate/glutamate racemase family protein [Pseudomonadota bacterium]
MHIGLIGGIGVAATVAYYQRITAACTHAPDLTIVHADAQTLVRNNVADDRVAQAEIYAKLIDRLQAAGADCVAITSLGGHFCYAETVERASLPLISAVAPLDDHFRAEGYDTVGLLGTEVVMRTALYGQLQKTRALAPVALQDVGDAYRNMAVAGHCSADLAAYFVEEGRKLVDAGAEAVVLAGTDLNLAFDQCPADYPVIDALDVHVAVLVELAMGRRPLD